MNSKEYINNFIRYLAKEYPNLTGLTEVLNESAIRSMELKFKNREKNRKNIRYSNSIEKINSPTNIQVIYSTLNEA